MNPGTFSGVACDAAALSHATGLNSLHSKRFHQERPLICGLFDALGGRFPRAVAGARFDADQHRMVTILYFRLRRLQCRSVLETVPWIHAVIVVRCGDQRGWIANAPADVVIG